MAAVKPPVDTAFEKQIQAGQKMQLACLDHYEQTVGTLIETYEHAAEAVQLPWVAELVTSQAKVARDLNKTFLAAAREQAA